MKFVRAASLFILCLNLQGCLSETSTGGSSSSSSSSSSTCITGTYGGITSATVTYTDAVTVVFPASGSTTSGVKIYSILNGTKTLAATVGNAATSYVVSGLTPNTTYSFQVNPVDPTTGKEDCNTFQQTVTLPKHTYNGVMALSAYGAAANAPSGTPTAKQVTITWATSGTNVGAYFYLYRVGRGISYSSLSTAPACTNTTTSTCLVCTVYAGSAGAKSCTDSNVAASPQQYDYIVGTQSGSTYLIPYSDSSYRISVPIPPDNMVLVHRDAANYEQCTLMGKTPDPLNHQRCAYTGLGAVAYNSNPGNSSLGLTSGYFDMGYNFFVDRWVAACNWTPAATTGMCGAGATSGNCFGNAVPASTVGVPGNVFYKTDDGNCYYKRTAGAAWISANTSSLSSTERATMYTIDPGAAGNNRKPPMVAISQLRSWDTCQSIYNSDYGYKRLLRQREYRAMAAWPSITGEPNALTDTVIGGMEDGSTYAHSIGNYSCNSNSHNGVAAGAFNTTNLSGDAGNVVGSFTIGAIETSKCVSRYGAQDHVGNVWQWVSDQATCSNVSHTCSGASSALDSGNGYTNGYDMKGFEFDGVQGTGGTSAGQVPANYSDAWSIGSGIVGGTGSGQGYGSGYFNTILGLPMVGTDSGNALLISSNSSKIHSDYMYLYTDNGNASRGLFVGGDWNTGSSSGRWASYWYGAPASANLYIGFRCGLPAE